MQTLSDSKIILQKLRQIPRNCQCKWLLALLVGSKNFCKLLSVFCEVFVLHGYDWIHWAAKSCTTTASRWLFRDSHSSLSILWSAVIKSRKFSARGMASPVRFLQGTLVMSVLWQILQFRSFGKWVWTLFLPDTICLSSSREGSWRELACESPESRTPSDDPWILAAIRVFRKMMGHPIPADSLPSVFG